MTDRLQSNVLTVAPDGTISADFTGTVNALGIIIPVATTDPGQKTNSILWVNPDGTTAAEIYAGQGFGGQIVIQAGGEALTLLSGLGGSAFLQGAQNLSDLPDKTAARANLGLGQPGGAYLTASRTVTSTSVQPIQADAREGAPLNNNLISTAGWVQYQCPRAGVYLVTVRATLLTSANSWFNANVYKNNARYANCDQQQTVSAGQTYTISGSVLVPASAGDLLEGGFSVGAVNATGLSGGFQSTGWQVLQVA